MNAAWSAYDGFPTRAAALAARDDVRASMGDRWDVRMRTVSGDSLPYQVQTRERAPEYMGHPNRATWVAAAYLHNDETLYRMVHDPARRALLRERPWTVRSWAIALRAAWSIAHPDARREARMSDGAIDWQDIARDCRAECLS